MGPETEKEGWEVLQPVGRIEWGQGKKMGEPLARTRLLWVSREPTMEAAGAKAGCSMTSGPAPHPCPSLTQSHGDKPGQWTKQRRSMCGSNP